MPLPNALRLNVNHFLVVWGFLYPLLKKRAAASAPLWDDTLVETANRLFQSEAFLKLFEQVLNREKPVQALELEAPHDVSRADARAFAGNYQFVEGWVRDTAASLNAAPYVTPQADCNVADAATCLHTLNEANKSGASMEPDAHGYMVEQQLKASASSPAAGSQVAGKRMPDTWLGPAPGTAVAQAGSPAYAGAPSGQQYQSAQPVGFAQEQAEKMHLPSEVTGAAAVGAHATGDHKQPVTEQAQYSPSDTPPATVAVSQPSTATNTAEAAQMASQPVNVATKAPVAGQGAQQPTVNAPPQTGTVSQPALAGQQTHTPAGQPVQTHQHPATHQPSQPPVSAVQQAGEAQHRQTQAASQQAVNTAVNDAAKMAGEQHKK